MFLSKLFSMFKRKDKDNANSSGAAGKTQQSSSLTGNATIGGAVGLSQPNQSVSLDNKQPDSSGPLSQPVASAPEPSSYGQDISSPNKDVVAQADSSTGSSSSGPDTLEGSSPVVPQPEDSPTDPSSPPETPSEEPATTPAGGDPSNPSDPAAPSDDQNSLG